MNTSIRSINLKTSILPISTEILDIMQNPHKYNLEENFITLRNPDALYTHIDKSGAVVIDGIGEAKLGHLNERAINQLELFPENLKYICNLLNNKPEFKDPINLRNMGLDNLYTLRWTLDPDAMILKISPTFTQFLIVPANRNTDRAQGESELQYHNRLFYELVHKNLHENKKMKERFMSIVKNLRIAKVAFTTQEISAMADYLYDQAFPKEPNK